jgi:hypothetical protein
MGVALSRRFRPGDASEIVSIYNMITGRSRTVEQHNWEWMGAPEGRRASWVIEYEEDGQRRVVGHHGLIPLRFVYFDQEILVGKTENSLVHPEYRKKVLYARFEERFFREARDQFDFLYTVSGTGVLRRIREHLGYRMVGDYVFYSKITDIKGLRSRIALYLDKRIRPGSFARFLTGSCSFALYLMRAAGKILNPKKSGGGLRLEAVESVDKVARDIGAFWDANKRFFKITVDRNPKYLKWRIFSNPNIANSFFLARMGEEIVGYAITKEAKDGQASIVDIQAKGNSVKIFRAIIDRLEDELRKGGVYLLNLKTLRSGNFLNKAARKSGFTDYSGLLRIVKREKRKERSVLLARATSGRIRPEILFDPANWYFTDILSEGIR